ncbi:MAG TPA: hypothetical protein VD838_08310 [Anaeromyxobacteraceae bacterium]|nr:hypothetical protein [Anaeromyxobacteraceae bacterium]
MAFDEELDSPEAFEAKETKHRLPVAFVVLMVGIVGWCVWYFFAMQGWTQAAALDAPDTTSGLNLFATILFTTAAAVAAVAMLLAQRRGSGKPHPAAPLSTTSRGEGGDRSRRT